MGGGRGPGAGCDGLAPLTRNVGGQPCLQVGDAAGLLGQPAGLLLRQVLGQQAGFFLLGTFFLNVGLDDLAHDTLAPAGLDEPGQHEACRHDQDKQRAIGAALGKVGEVAR